MARLLMHDDQHPSLPDPLRVSLQITKEFEKLQILYFIGGSLASAIHGTVRATMDADFVADIRIEHINQLVADLQNDFYMDAEAILHALQSGMSFNSSRNDV